MGVRGAAVLGGVVLALAGMLFLRYSVEHGLIPPGVRVTVGIVAGLGCKGRSRYGLGLPSAIATLDRIALDTPAAFFDWGFELAAVDAEGRRCTLARGRLVRRGGDGRPVEITFPPARVASLELMVDDGSDAPLTFRAEGRFAAPELFFAAPAGRYTLLLGNPEDQGDL